MGAGINAVLFFGFGIAAGILIAFAGAGYLEDSASTVVSVFFALLLGLLVLGVVIFAARRPIWRRLFGMAEATLEQFAAPLARVAERAIERDPTGATQAARDLVSLVLARYSWIATRRWLVASLTALVAAMAALAGTALLFKQNQLLGDQSALLAQQNERIEEQTGLLVQQVELAEAARNAALAVEITAIAGELGVAADASGGGTTTNLLNRLDIRKDVGRGLILRITSVSRALKPYRFLDTGLKAGDPSDSFRIAMQRLRDERPETWTAMAGYYGWPDAPGQTRLVDRPASPERGQLLNTLVTGGLRDIEALNVAGLDLSYAYLPDIRLAEFSAQAGQISYADFTGAMLSAFDFGGSVMLNSRFVRARLDDGDFSTVPPARARFPLTAEAAPYQTFLTGADFSDAVLRRVRFDGAALTTANLDGAVLAEVSLAGANLGLATLRQALILQADFTGATLSSTDFDGAVVFGADALERLAATAAEGTFLPAGWELQPVKLEELLAEASVAERVSPEDLAAAMAAGEPFRIRRVGEPLK